MNNGLQFLDILIFAMVAGFLLLRLHRALGRRTGNEQPPPFLQDNEEAQERVIQMPRPGADTGVRSDEASTDKTPGLTEIKAADPNFDDRIFLDGAGEAFEIILAAFAKGNKQELRGLLDDTTYQSFVTEIERREGARERLETTLVSMKDAVITEAQMADFRARITVKFASEQVNVTYDEADEVVAGDPSRVANINDVWTFARDVRSRDPNWQLVGTRAVD